MKSSEVHAGLKPVRVKEKCVVVVVVFYFFFMFTPTSLCFLLLLGTPSQGGKEGREEAKQGLT